MAFAATPVDPDPDPGISRNRGSVGPVFGRFGSWSLTLHGGRDEESPHDPNLRRKYGSSGRYLSIVPADGITKDEDIGKHGVKDEVVRVRESYWYTSGRFLSARLASRLFPSLRGRARELYAAQLIAPRDELSTAPYPSEIVDVVGLHATYIDPPGVSGVADEGAGLTPNDTEIHGSIMHVGAPASNEGADSILVLAVRLRAERDPLVAAILADFNERTRSCSGAEDCFGLERLPRCFDGTEVEEDQCK